MDYFRCYFEYDYFIPRFTRSYFIFTAIYIEVLRLHVFGSSVVDYCIYQRSNAGQRRTSLLEQGQMARNVRRRHAHCHGNSTTICRSDHVIIVLVIVYLLTILCHLLLLNFD